ncbi:MAG: thiol reductant ABC exporter subunit CydD [Spirochaetales bacterium]
MKTKEDLWLMGLAGRIALWTRLAVVAGLLGMVFTIVQAALVAWFLAGLVMDHKALADLLWLWAPLPGVLLLKVLATWAKEEAGVRASQQVRGPLRQELLAKIHDLGPAWKTGQQSGALVSKLMEQVDGLDAWLAKYLPQKTLSMAGPALVLAVVFPINWACGLLLLVTAPLIPLFMSLVGRGARVEQTKQYLSLSRMSGAFLDLVRGLPSLRLVDAHRRQTPRVAAVSEEFRVRTMSVLRLAFLSSTVLEFFTMLSIALTAIYLGFSLLHLLNFGAWNGSPDLGMALFVLILAPEFYLPLRELGVHYHAQAEAKAAALQVLPVFAAQARPGVAGEHKPAAGAPRLDLRGVHFAHVPGVPILAGLDLTVAAGEAVAITGPSGAGKTTLLRLIAGQLAPDEGTLLVNGEPLLGLSPEAWKESLGWMNQHPRVLSATLAENLRIARTEASDADLHEALKFAGLDALYQTLDRGLDTLLGEEGRGLSGGQQRRLGLARVYLRRAGLLLLDEPTASLDHETEGLILDRLAVLKKDRTLVVLTHHAQPLEIVDRVLDLRAGRLTKAGLTAGGAS